MYVLSALLYIWVYLILDINIIYNFTERLSLSVVQTDRMSRSRWCLDDVWNTPCKQQWTLSVFRPPLKGTKWSTRWSRTLSTDPTRSWRSWGGRAKGRTPISTSWRRTRWEGCRHFTDTANALLSDTAVLKCSLICIADFKNLTSILLELA